MQQPAGACLGSDPGGVPRLEGSSLIRLNDMVARVARVVAAAAAARRIESRSPDTIMLMISATLIIALLTFLFLSIKDVIIFCLSWQLVQGRCSVE